MQLWVQSTSDGQGSKLKQERWKLLYGHSCKAIAEPSSDETVL